MRAVVREPVSIALRGRWAGLPIELARRHAALAVGTPVEITASPRGGGAAERLADVVVGGGFTLASLTATEDGVRARAVRARTLPDFVGPGLALVVCGLNPSLYAADAGVGFARPGNRYWPAALAAGLVTRDRDPWDALRSHGIGMTDLVKRATRAADELTRLDYCAGVQRVERLAAWLAPKAICFVGLAGYRLAVDRRAQPGVQPHRFGGVATYLMPNTSGLNARVPLEQLTEHLRAAAHLAGL